MKKRACFLGWVGTVLLVVVSSVSLAQEKAAKAPDPLAVSIRVYRLPGSDLDSGFVSKERGQLHAPPLPPATASADELKAFMKRSQEVVKEYLAQQGVVLPQGSLVCYDPASGTLALRGVVAAHETLESLSNAMLRKLPQLLNWALDIVEAPASAVRAALKEVAGKSDHTTAFDHLLAQGKVAVTMRGETKSGQRTSARQGSRVQSPTEYTADNQHRVAATKEETLVGTELELDPTVGTYDHIIDVNFALTHRYAPPIPRWEALTTGTDKLIEARWHDYSAARVTTAMVFADQTARLLGVWTLEGTPELERIGTMQAAFLRVSLVKSLPLEERRVEELIKTHGEAVEPTPKTIALVADPKLPPGMIVRRFLVPPDFLSLGGDDKPAAAPADPFASRTTANEPRFTRQVTAEDILKSNDIAFPEGASANYLASSHELVVRNTLANMEMVETFMDSLLVCRYPPKVLAFTLHIVQADAALIRRLDRETMTIPDHAAALKAIEDAAAQGKAKFVRSIRLETRSGQRASVENVIDYAKSNGAELTAATTTSEAKPEEGKTGPTAKASVVASSGERLLSATAETVPVGLRMELDPTLGSDGDTIDVNLNVDYTYAPPFQTLVKEPLPDNTQRLATPTTEFRDTSINTATTLLSGATRMISIWKPTGTPEFAGDILQAAFLTAERVTVEPAHTAAR